MAELNIAKFNIPISIKRAFAKGNIADSYSKMYVVADKFASIEAQRRLPQKTAEYFTHMHKDNDDQSIIKTTGEVLDYKNERIDYHMANMIHLMELYVTSLQKE